MDSKLDILEFRKFKNQLQDLSKQYKILIQSNDFFRADDTKKEAILLQRELLSNDLSLVPFEEWANMKFYFDNGVLDFSKTHANLDFKILNISLNNRKLNLEGCNVVNVDSLYYDEDSFTPSFVSNNTELFLDKSFPKSLRERFYEYKITIDDLISYPELKKYINDSKRFVYSSDVMVVEKLFKTFGKDNTFQMIYEYPNIFKSSDLRAALRNMFYTSQSNLSYEDAEEILCDILINYKFRDFEFLEDISFKSNEDDISNRLKILNIIYGIDGSILKNNIINYISLKDVVDIDKINLILELYNRMTYSNSSEIVKVKDALITQLLDLDEPFLELEKIENMFLRSSLPYVGEVFSMFEMMHPNFKDFDFSDRSMISPVLKKCSNRGKRAILFADLLKASMGSNNRSLKNYVYNIKQGDNLLKKVSNKEVEYDELNFFEKRILDMYCDRLSVLYNNTLKGKSDNFISSNDNIKDIEILKKLFSENGKIVDDLPDRIVRCFAYFAGIETVDELVSYIDLKKVSADKRNRENSKKDFILQTGDFVKGIDSYKFLPDILQNGSVAVDFLGVNASRDFTPLDTDVSKVFRKGVTLWDTVSNTEASGYGDTFLLFRNDDRFITTRADSGEDILFLDSSKKQFRTNKLESFYTGNGYAIRGGVASCEIDAIMRENFDEVSKIISMEIVKNGFYIPIVDKYGTVVFTPEDYDKMKEKLYGLSYYGYPDFKFSSNLVNEDVLYYNDKINDNIKYASEKNNFINNTVRDVCSSFGLDIKTMIDGDIRKGSVEFINIGSTGRGTNTFKDKNFNFVLRFDKEIILNKDNFTAIKDNLVKSFGKEDVLLEDDKLVLKDVDVLGDLVDINITFDSRKDRIVYSNDMALRDRLNSIRMQDSSKYMDVISNILVGKEILKDSGLKEEAIEDMILQNGGSFVDFSREFLNAADGHNFSEFKDLYYVFSFGEDFDLLKKSEYPYINYIDNIDSNNYENIKNILKKYLDSVNVNKSTVSSNVK